MDIQAYVKRADLAMNDGEFDLAERYYRQILSEFPYNPEALQGLKDLEIAQAKKRWNGLIWGGKLLWCQAMILAGKGASVYDLLQLVHRVRPDNDWGAMALAMGAEKLGKWEDAHQAYDTLLKLNPAHQRALEKDAEILLHLDRMDEAEKRLQRLLSLRPHDDRIAHRLRDISAKVYTRVGIPEDLKARRRQMEKEKKEMLGTPEFVEKLEALKRDYEANPQDSRLGVSIAAHYREGGFFDQASQVLGSILDRDATCLLARREQARVWRKSGDLQIAVQLYEELRQEAPEDHRLRDEWMDALIAYKQETYEKGNKPPQELNDIERLKLEREKNKIDFLQHLLAERPESFEERAELGELLLKHGRVDEAITTLQRLVHELPFASQGFFLLGQCFRAKGDPALAILQFEKSLEFLKDRGYAHIPSESLKSIYYYMGLAKEATGDRKGAREAYGHVYSADIHFKDIRERYEKIHLT